MNQIEKRNRMICNGCKHVFDIREAIVKYTNLYGIKVPEKRCPICGSTFRAIEVPGDLDLFLHINTDEKYYTYPDKGVN